MRLLMIGPEYQQIALKTEEAAAHLKWISSEVLDIEELKKYRETVMSEQTTYQMQLPEALDQMEREIGQH